MNSKSALYFAGLLLFSLSAAYSQQPKTSPRKSKPATDSQGQQVFSSICAGCHGLDGMGTQRAPNIITNAQVQKFSPAELTRVISEGVPGAGMPAFQSLGSPAITSLVAYIREMQGKSKTEHLPGDPKRGQELFFGSAQCSNCHMVEGKGGFIGPDLSLFGQAHSAEQVRAAITNPAERNSVKTMVSVVSKDGSRFEGIVRNEDNFSLELQSTDGTFRLLSKNNLTSIQRAPNPVMPSDYASRLKDAEINDIVNYLLSTGKPSQTSHSRGEDDD